MLIPKSDDTHFEGPLANAYIKFRSREDAVAGFQALLSHYDVTALTNDVFCVPQGSLDLLDTTQVGYSLASQDDIAAARPLWDVSSTSNR